MPIARPMPSCTSAPRSTKPRTFPAVGSERHPDSNLGGSSSNGIGCYAVQPEAGQDECEKTKHLRKSRNEPFLIKVTRHLLVKAYHPQYRIKGDRN